MDLNLKNTNTHKGGKMRLRPAILKRLVYLVIFLLECHKKGVNEKLNP
jgi:hypothetical protein